MDLVDLYETLFSGMAPFKLIDALAEKEALELEMMDWELVALSQQQEECVEDDGPPIWPYNEGELEPCPEPPEPKPDGRPPKPSDPEPEPQPPTDGKPLPIPDESCQSERMYVNVGAFLLVPMWHMGADYNCYNFQGKAVLEDKSNEIDYEQRIIAGTTKLKALMKKSGNWVGKQNTFLGEENNTDNGWYSYYIDDGVTGKKIIFKIQPAFDNELTLYHWKLRVDKMFALGVFPIYPSIDCVILDDDC